MSFPNSMCKFCNFLCIIHSPLEIFFSHNLKDIHFSSSIQTCNSLFLLKMNSYYKINKNLLLLPYMFHIMNHIYYNFHFSLDKCEEGNKRGINFHYIHKVVEKVRNYCSFIDQDKMLANLNYIILVFRWNWVYIYCSRLNQSLEYILHINSYRSYKDNIVSLLRKTLHCLNKHILYPSITENMDI